MSDFGWYGSIIDVAKTGVLGKLKEVEKAKMWDFINVLAYNKADNETNAKLNS